MRLKIDVMERECKNLEFGREVNKAQVYLCTLHHNLPSNEKL
jgi:hypothetical protein